MVSGAVNSEFSDTLGSLPALFALDIYSVHRGKKRSASVQLDQTYFDGQLDILRALDSTTDTSARVETLRRSHQRFEDIEPQIESLTRQALEDESRRLLELLQELPEYAFLREHVPGTCTIVPEWSRGDSQLRYGVRVYVFREGDAPAPIDIIRENVDALIADEVARFDRYRGDLHGYPECCVTTYLEGRNEHPPPEWRSMREFDHLVDDDILADRRHPSTSVSELVPGVFDTDGGFRFFAREFFPEEGCDAAREMGEAIYDELTDEFAEPLVQNYYKLNFGFSYLMARAAVTQAPSRPPPGFLGREHRHFYLPLNALTAIYRSNQA